ncbi:MAG TPA: uroporphyrinogen decarboxylase family protein, partial [Rhizobacter sp.]|nr:uroporphyrinogen decarboxylase family protein [Rhizobacter sp.]
MLYSRPDLMHRMLKVNADAVAAYLNAQIEAGAQAVMIFDSRGGVLADGAFQTFSLDYTRRVLAQVKREHNGARIPHIVFTKGGGLWLEEIAATGADVVGLDWTVNLAAARRRIGHLAALQGNLDPNVLFATPEQVRAEVVKTLESFGTLNGNGGSAAGHIFNLGHGISQHTPPESVTALVDAVHEHSPALHRRA